MQVTPLFSGGASTRREDDDDDGLNEHHFDLGEEETMQDRSSTKTPSGSSARSTDTATFNDNAIDFHHQTLRAMDGNNGGSPADKASEFDAIARDAALLLEQKLQNNRDWVKKLVHEMTVYAKTLSEIHSEYTRIQRLEHEESLRLDQVEPDVQGATSHLLRNPFMGGRIGQLSLDDGANLGAKRKSEQA